MKKIILLIPIILFSFVLVGCGEKSNQEKLEEVKEEKQSQIKQQDKKEVTKTSKSNSKNSNQNNKDMMPQESQEDLTKTYDRVVLKTTLGDVTIKLFVKRSPITTNNFLNLAKADYFDGIKFHRVIEGFMIQGGDPLTKDDSQKNRWGTGGPGYAIEDEFIEGLSNEKGTIAMANSGPNSGGSQFFINLADNTNLDWNKQPMASKHPVFGQVTVGMGVVEKIGATKTGPRDVPVEAIVIEDVELK